MLTAGLLSLLVAGLPAPVVLNPTVATQPVASDADDPAIWVHPTRPERSLVFGTDKVEEDGGIYAFDLDGRIVQRIRGLDRPNNIDVQKGFRAGRRTLDLAVATERKKHRLKVYAIDARTGRLRDVSGDTEVLAGETGEAREPMGIALYRRPRDGAVFAIVSPKTGPKTDYLAQYQLAWNEATGKVDAQLVRRFGNYSGVKEIESIAVDDALGYVYYSDETVGTRKQLADPAAPGAGEELALFNTEGFRGDHEGIGIWEGPRGTGWIVCTDQLPGSSVYYVYRREGEPGMPHLHRPVAAFRGGADETDGIDVTSAYLGPRFSRGLLAAMDSGPKRFLFFNWQSIASRVLPR